MRILCYLGAGWEELVGLAISACRNASTFASSACSIRVMRDEGLSRNDIRPERFRRLSKTGDKRP